MLIISACSSSTESTSENKLSSPVETYYTSNNLKIVIPHGWKEIKDNHEQLFDIWLVNDNNNAVIGFIPITIDESVKSNSIDEQLDIIEIIIRNKRKSTSSKFEIIEENKIVSDYYIRSLKFNIDETMQNSLLFGNGENFYESLAYFKIDYKPTLPEINNLIEVQKQIVMDCSIK